MPLNSWVTLIIQHTVQPTTIQTQILPIGLRRLIQDQTYRKRDIFEFYLEFCLEIPLSTDLKKTISLV